MKIRELRQLTLEELEQKERDFRKEFFDLRFQRVTGKLEKPSRIGEIKKAISRVKMLKSSLKVSAGGARLRRPPASGRDGQGATLGGKSSKSKS
jgi:large subunit ribosomal protein L29